MFSGDFFKAQSIVSKEDIKALEAYNASLANTEPAEAFDKTMKDASATAQNLAKSAKGAAVDINSIPKASKAAAAGMKLLSGAMNVGLNILLSFAVSAIIGWIDDLVHAQERVIEKAEEINDKFREQQNALSSNKKTIDSISADYEKLSKGVSDTGANISLSTEEYTKYNNIVNQIADMFPTMVRGYTAEGNAIIAHKGNVEELTKAYKEQAKAARDGLISKGDEVFAGAEAELDELNEKIKTNEAAQWLLRGGKVYSGVDDARNPFESDIIQKAEKLLKEQGIERQLQTYASGESEYVYTLPTKWNSKTQQYEDPSLEDVQIRAEKRNNLERDYNLLLAQREGIVSKTNSVIQAYLENEISYDAQNEDTKNLISMLSSSLDPSNFDFDDDKMKAWVKTNILIPIANATPETKQAIADLFSLDKTKLPAKEWESTANKLIDSIVGGLTFKSDEEKQAFVKNLKIQLGFEFTVDGKTTTSTLIEEVEKKFDGTFKDEIGKLSEGDLKILANLDISPEGIEDWSEVETLIANAKKEADELTASLNSLSSAVTSAKNALELFNDVEKDFKSTGAISAENISKLLQKFPDLEDEIYEYIMGLRSGASVMDLLKAKSSDMATMSEDAFKKMYMSSNSASKNIIGHADNMFKAFDLGYQRELTIAENVNTKIIDSNGTVCETFVKQWGDAVENAGGIMQAFASGFSNLLTGTFFDGESGLYKGADGNWYNKSQYDDNGDGYLDTANMTDVWMEKIKEQSPGLNDAEARERANTAIDSYANAAKKNNEKIAADKKAFEEKLKEYARTSDNKTGSDKNEALDNYLKDAENRYKIHQDETKYIQELQYAYANLTKDEKERLDITGKINEAYRDLADNRIKDIEHQIDLVKELHGDDADVTNYYREIQRISHEEANRLRSMGYDDNSNEIQDLQKTWWDAENSKIDFYTKQHENIIRDIEHARDMELEKNPYADTTSYYKQMQAEYHKQAEYLRALDPEKYKEEIQELQQAWSDAQKEIADWSYSNSERWINERNTYNDWGLYGDNEIAAWQRVLERFQTEFPNELEKIKDIEQKIFELRKEEMEKSIQDIEDYIDARNTYNDWDAYGDSEVRAIQRITKEIEKAYRERLLSHEEYIDKLEEQSQKIYQLGQDRVDKHLSNIDKYIDARNHYNDWGDFNDSEIEAIKRQCEVLDEAYRLNLISLEDYTERVAEYTQKLYSVAKDNIIEEVSKLIEDYEEMKNLESSQLGSQKTLLQSYYDVTNAIAEAQHEINNELKASMTMYEYLNEETRELLFNQEDYNILNEELLEIQSAADALQKQYQEDILNASAETIAEITSQYQMQYETMMKQYDIAKAELEVAKKRQKLDNVLAERNTRMFINGQWQWVAKTQDVINAQNELAEAEIERKKREASLEQTEAINKFTEQINALDTDLNKTRKWWSDTQKMLNGEADDVAKALNQISEVSSPELKKVVEATGGTITSFSTSLSESTNTLNTVINSDLSSMSTGISTIITDLESYSDAIKSLVNKMKELDINNEDDDDKSYNKFVQDTIAEMKENSEKWHSASEEEKQALADRNKELGDSIGANRNDETGVWYDSNGNLLYSVSSSGSGSSSLPPKDSSSSIGGSSSGSSSSYNSTATTSSGTTINITIDSNGNTTNKGLSTGTVVHTSGGDYKIVSAGTKGATYNSGSGYWSIKLNADGSRYTSGGLNIIGEEGFEAFITNNGRLIPINQPTLGNIGAGGIVFNREQMANLRTLWDWSNLSKVSPFVSSSNANSQNTVIDNSIHINGMTISEKGNEDWINGFRRYVATHK